MRRKGVFDIVDAGSAMLKAARIRVGERGTRFLSRGLSSLARSCEDDSVALEEALALDIHLTVPGESTPARSLSGDPMEGAPLALASSMHGSMYVPVLGWKGAVAERAAARALRGSGAVVSAVVSPETRWIPPVSPPDCVFCVGPPGEAAGPGDFDPRWFVDCIEMMPPAPVLYSGGVGGLGILKGALGDRVTHLRDDGSPLVFAGILGRLHTRRAERAVARYIASRGSGGPLPPSTRVVPAAAAMECALVSLAGQGPDRVVFVDAGSSSTAICEASGSGFSLAVAGGAGTGLGVAGALERIPSGQRVPSLLDWCANRRSRPWIVPESPAEREAEDLVLRACVRRAVEERGVPLRPFSPGLSGFVILAGGLRQYGQPQHGQFQHRQQAFSDVARLLGELKPVGVFRAAVDQWDSVMQLGALRACFAACPAVDTASLVSLGTFLAPVADGLGSRDNGAPCVRLEIEGIGRTVVEWGSLIAISLSAGEKAVVRIVPASGVDVGEGPGKPAVAEVAGGVLGFVVDARGNTLDS
ncbi:MAG: hypothetical protein ACM3WT_08710 [Bacillota bacterium]